LLFRVCVHRSLGSSVMVVDDWQEKSKSSAPLRV
jgi:hypothetical protein